MRGDPGSTGQLALMDALVFLAVALLVSSLMLRQVEGPAEPSVTDLEDTMPHSTTEVLAVVMESSLGDRVAVDLWDRFVIPADTSFAECLLLEATAVMAGADASSFEEVEARIQGVVDSLLGPSLRGHLLVVVSEQVETAVVVIEHRPVESMQVSAASQVLSDDGTRVVVRLLVEPALRLEPLDV